MPIGILFLLSINVTFEVTLTVSITLGASTNMNYIYDVFQLLIAVIPIEYLYEINISIGYHLKITLPLLVQLILTQEVGGSGKNSFSVKYLNKVLDIN